MGLKIDCLTSFAQVSHFVTEQGALYCVVLCTSFLPVYDGQEGNFAVKWQSVKGR